MAGKQTDWKGLAKAIREILIREWNPIGFTVPGDEYDSYVPGILRLLTADAREAEIGSYLEQIQTVNMGLQGNMKENSRVAQSSLNEHVIRRKAASRSPRLHRIRVEADGCFIC